MAKQGKWIINADIVLPEQVVRGSIFIAGNQIAGIYEGERPLASIEKEHEVIDAQQMFVLPGLIDIHCDAIEKEVQPRPGALFPMNLALRALEKKLAGNGITTMYHSVSLGVGLSVFGDHLLAELLDQIGKYRMQRAMIRHRVHLRYELIYLPGLEWAQELVRSGIVDYLSFMSHGPGQGQYKLPGSFEAYVMKNQGVGPEEVREIAENALKKMNEIDWERVKALAELARSSGIPLASHDDDSKDKVIHAAQLGVSVSEFPLNMKTALAAKEGHLSVCVGAPNVIRGGSHDKNLSALDAIGAGAADILCSDYSPSTLLPAVFKVASGDLRIPLPRAAQMASLAPARAMGIDKEYGSIECGKFADLLLVELSDGYPCIKKTIVNGTVVYSADFYQPSC